MPSVAFTMTKPMLPLTALRLMPACQLLMSMPFMDMANPFLSR